MVHFSFSLPLIPPRVKQDQIRCRSHLHPNETSFPASLHSPVVSSALSAITSKWDVPIFTLPFNILICLHIAATGATHPFFPQVCCQFQFWHDAFMRDKWGWSLLFLLRQVDFQPKTRLHVNESESLNLSQVIVLNANKEIMEKIAVNFSSEPAESLMAVVPNVFKPQTSLT